MLEYFFNAQLLGEICCLPHPFEKDKDKEHEYLEPLYDLKTGIYECM